MRNSLRARPAFLLPLLLLAAAAPAPAPLTIITRAEWGSNPDPLPDAARHTPKLFTIHHAGVLWKDGDEPFQKIRNLQSWGKKEKKWPDLPYHYLIAPDGRVFEGRDWNYRPESNTKYELTGVLNIELMGNFEEQRVSTEQLTSLVQLVAKLSSDLNMDPATLRGHGDAAAGQTTCPGKDVHRYITTGTLLAWVNELRAGKTPNITPMNALPEGPTTQISTRIAPPTPKPLATQPAN